MGTSVEFCCCAARDPEKQQRDIMNMYKDSETEKKFGRIARMKH